MKVICSQCGKMVDKFNHDCKVKKERSSQYNKKYNNKKTVRAIKSTQWKELRKLILQEKGAYCQRCYYKYGIINGDKIQIDHIIPREYDDSLIFDEDNLLPLCRSCNAYKGKKVYFEPKKEWKYPYKVGEKTVYLDWEQPEKESNYNFHL